MSVIRKIPYIETVVSVLSKTLMGDLKTIINEGGDNISLDFAALTSSYKNKVTPVYFNLENGTKTGILIWNEPITGAYDKEETYNAGDYVIYGDNTYVCLEDNVTGSWNVSKWKQVNYCALICYHRFPDLMLLDIDTKKHTYKKVNEYCTIDELRRIVFASDKADLVNGKIPQDQLPSYVDDVINGYYHDGEFYEENTYTTEIPAEEGKIYVDLATNITYRWSGLAYIQIGGGSVEANPTLDGTEAELTGLQIGDAKYKVLTLLRFTNVEASTWVSDSTVTGFSYKCVLSCTGITGDSVVYVKFGDTEVASGNYSSTVETGANTVTIWSKVNTSITIPLIKEI